VRNPLILGGMAPVRGERLIRRILLVGLLLALLPLGQDAVVDPGHLAVYANRSLTSGVGPHNVILFIGDGMGFEQVKAAGMYAHGSAGTLSFEALPYQARVTTYSASSSVTDSAAAATALATGFKVNNGVLSLAIPGDGRELETVLEHLRDQGKRTGLVTTAFVTHATPAGFGAHEPSRLNYSAIAGDYLNQTLPDVLFGGGGNGITPEAAEAAGYTVVISRTAMQALNTETVTRTSGQFGDDHLPYEYDGLGELPHLSEMTEVALDILDTDPDGFFLMVEGARIDHAGHANDLPRGILETIEFANAVGEALEWAQGRADTLVLVTADHETGGLAVLGNNGQGEWPDVSWSTTTHTGAEVPIYGWGVNAELVTGTLDNTDLFDFFTQTAVAGLTATNDSPTPAGYPTTLTATVTAGSNVTYTWAFGDGAFGAGAVVSHTYSGGRAFTAVVTASNPLNPQIATTAVALDWPHQVYLPVVLNPG
jgi:alkaline phosphatase